MSAACNHKGGLIYKGDIGKWTCIDCGEDYKKVAQDKASDVIKEQDTRFSSNPKCECGAEKANTTHARWCPKYT